MFRKLLIPVLFILIVLVLAGCGQALLPPTSGETPVGESTPAPESPGVTPEAFVEDVLIALGERDPAGIQALMGDSFFYGWWRWEKMDLPPADATTDLLENNLSPDSSLALSQDVDLEALLGVDPASIPGSQANIVHTALVTGWGLSGRDEAILFIAELPDGSLYWHGALVVQGGITSPQTGGVQLLTNEANGYSLWYPKGFEVTQPSEAGTIILAPPSTEGHRERAFITVEDAGGRNVEQVIEELLADYEGFEIDQTMTIVGGEAAMILDNLPGQDINRLVLVVHEGRLYRMMFVPADPAMGQAYEEMETAFGPVINTFQFLPLPPGEAEPTGEATGDLEDFREQLLQALHQRDPAQMQALMGEEFTFGFWRSEGVTNSPSEAAEQIRQNYLAPQPQLVFDTEKDLAQVLDGMEPGSMLGPSTPLVQAIFVSGWGVEGQDEAILFISQDSQGSLYWHSVLIAMDGFN